MEACEPLSHAGRVGQSHRDARFRLRSDPCFSVRVWAGVPEQAVSEVRQNGRHVVYCSVL